MKQFFLLVLLVIVVGVGFYIFLAPSPVVRSGGGLSPAAPTPAASEPIAEAPVGTPAPTPFPGRNFWPAEVTLKKEGIFLQTVGNGKISTVLPAGTVVQVQDIIAGMLSAKRGGMTAQVNVADTDFEERVERIKGSAQNTPAPVAVSANNPASKPAGETVAGSNAPVVFVSRNHQAAPATSAPADSLPPANHSGGIGRYDGLAAGNIMVVATPSTAAPSDGTPGVPGSDSSPRDGKVMLVRLSENGAAGEPPQVEFFIVVKSRGSHESVVSKSGTQDPSAPGRWTFDMNTGQPANVPLASAQDSKSGNESRVLGWFVRAIRNGRVIGYCASSFNYEQYAMDPAMVNTSQAR